MKKKQSKAAAKSSQSAESYSESATPTTPTPRARGRPPKNLPPPSTRTLRNSHTSSSAQSQGLKMQDNTSLVGSKRTAADRKKQKSDDEQSDDSFIDKLEE